MKVIIEHGVTKRAINGPFNICGSREDLLALADCIRETFLDAPIVYSWVRIIGAPQKSISNMPPSGWDE